MGIEWRKGRPYWYQRQRIEGKLRGTYGGSLSIPGAEELLRAQMEANHLERVRELREVEEVAKWAADVLYAGAEFDRLADSVFRAVMYLTGHQLYKRCEWRRKRGVKAMARVNDLVREPSKVRPALVCTRNIDPNVQRILERAARGDESVLPDVIKVLTDPNMVSSYGSVEGWARAGLIRAAAGGDLFLTEAVGKRQVEQYEKLLADGGPNPPYAEKMAARRAAHNWLTVHILEAKRERFDAESKQAAAVDQQLCRAERRLHASLKSLAVLRRLRKPVLIAQVNVANGPMLVTSTNG